MPYEMNDDASGGMSSCQGEVVLVTGYTSSGAIKGAIDNAELGNLSGLVAKSSLR